MKELHYESAMRRAIELAQRSPAFDENPRVGAVILNEAGNVMAEGWHRGVGTAHAEVDALNKLRDAGINPVGMTAVVTLEPCNHTGHTGPCSQALIDAGIGRVVFAAWDPGQVEGGGRFTLEAAGVEVIGPLLQDEYRPVLLPWIVNKLNRRPYVVIKYASSLDGRVAAADGTSKWITGSDARADVHLRRSQSQAILVGSNTVLVDDPDLTARKPDSTLYETQPKRFVVGQRELPASARIWQDHGFGPASQLHTRDLNQVMSTLWEHGIRQVFVEGGAGLESSLIAHGLADEFLIYLAPKLIGGPKTAIEDIEVNNIDQAVDLQIFETKALGQDILIRAIYKEN